ncbi:unnamed protein product, partial [Heterotrigona itama]
KKATNYCIRFGHSLWSANQLPAQGVEEACGSLVTVRRVAVQNSIHTCRGTVSATRQNGGLGQKDEPDKPEREVLEAEEPACERASERSSG